MAAIQQHPPCLTQRAVLHITSRRPMCMRPKYQNRSLRVRASAEPFDEGAAQVKRLLDRDRKELTGVEEIGGSLTTEFDEGPGFSTSSVDDPNNTRRIGGEAPQPSSPFTSKATALSPFGGPALSPKGPANPFGGASTSKPFIEPMGLSPDMQPADIDSEPWWTKISLAQVVIVLSFTLIISLMVATFSLVFSVGGVHFND